MPHQMLGIKAVKPITWAWNAFKMSIQALIRKIYRTTAIGSRGGCTLTSLAAMSFEALVVFLELTLYL